LLCALFNKTGTKKDLQDIRDRNIRVRKQISKLQKLKDQAICNGVIIEENIEEWKETLSISPWHPVMIVVPPTILEVWDRAFQDFSHFSISMYFGDSIKRTDAIKSVLYSDADILLVPHSAFQTESHYSDLEKVKWKLVIIDEFHNFKNYKAKKSLHLRQLKEQHQPLIIGMTGKYRLMWL
jgi:SNF2 family DNA or RNA helicase